MVKASDESKNVYAWLERARSESLLKGGQRRYDLLDYLIREELEGRGENLKAYAIALDVLGRNEDFDPATDSIVRVEVARLRDALELHYARSTDTNEPKISIPKGSYRPTIEFAPPDHQVEQATGSTKSRKPILFAGLIIGLMGMCILAYFAVFGSAPQPSQSDRPVVEIDSIAAGHSSPGYVFAQGFRQQLITDLAHLPTVTVRDGSLTEDVVRSAAAPEPDFRLTITPAIEGQSGIVGLQLSSLATATIVWTKAVPIADSTSDFYTQLTEAVRGIGQEVAHWFVTYRDAGYPVEGPDDLRQAGITGTPAQVISASLEQSRQEGLIYVCQAFFHKDYPQRQLGSRFHYGIKYIAL